MAPMTLYYFELPGRGETARLLLTIGGVEFIDKRFSFAEWPGIKPSMPFHQVPVLQLEDGRTLTQMAAIDRYCASLTGMLPADPWELAVAEQPYFLVHDIWEPISVAMRVETNPAATAEEKAAAWQEMLQPDGSFKQRMALLDEWLAKNCTGKFVTGDQLTYIDLAVFINLSLFQSGWMAGIPRDILSPYPALAGFRNAVAGAPAVAAYYAKEEDEVRRAGFRTDDAAAAAAAGAAADAPASSLVG